MTDSKSSLVDIAYEVLKNRYDAQGEQSVPMPFGELLIEVGKVLGTTDENHLIDLASRFYTALTTDGRFVIKENNTWVLREHELFENVHIDMNEVYSENDADESVEDELGKEDEDIDLDKDVDEDDEDIDDDKIIIPNDLDEDE